MKFKTFLNGLNTIESTRFNNTWNNVNYRFGTDLFLTDRHTLGFLVNGLSQEGVTNGWLARETGRRRRRTHYL